MLTLTTYIQPLYRKKIMRKVIHESNEVRTGGIRISNLRYADDMVLIADSENNLQNLIEKVAKKSKENELFLNFEKTKILILWNNKVVRSAHVNGEKLGRIEHFTYLGSEVTGQLWERKRYKETISNCPLNLSRT